jgi:hypothetical protein
MRESFSSQCEAVTHDSDIRKLTFVARDRVTGVETPLDAPLVLGMLNPIYGNNMFTRPFEIRNRNKATFQLKAVLPPDTIVQSPSQPVVDVVVPPTSVVIGHTGADWGFTQTNDHYWGFPTFLNMPPSPIAPDSLVLTKIKVTVGTAYAGPGLTSLVAEIFQQDQLSAIIGLNIDLMTPGVYETGPEFFELCTGQALSWEVVASTGINLNTLTDGSLTIELTFEHRNPGNITFQPATGFMGSGQPTDLAIPMPVFLPAHCTITKIGMNVIVPYSSGTGETYTVEVNPPTGPHLIGPVDVTIPGAVYTVSGLTYAYDSSLGVPLNLHIHSNDLTALLAQGLLEFEIFYTVPVAVPYAWSNGDTLSILAFVSLDDKQYVPISLARHDWSNTPFVDIIKFDWLNLPDDLDPGDNPTLGIGLVYPTLDKVAFRNAIMLFLSEFDNLSTWNYIRFWLFWNPSENSSNSEVGLEITVNAREL